MIFKLTAPAKTFVKDKEDKISTPLNKADRIKADRLVMIILFLVTIIGAIIFS